MIVLVGSTRPAKVEGARAALDAIAAVDARFRGVSVETCDVTGVAPRMPMSLSEVVAGARARATALLSRPRAEAPAYAVGLEGGLHPLPDSSQDWTLHTWAAVTDGRRWGFGAGPALLLPRAVGLRVLAGEELGDVVDAMAGTPVRGTRGAWGLLTRDLIGRRDAFRLAVLAAFAPFYHPAPYDDIP